MTDDFDDASQPPATVGEAVSNTIDGALQGGIIGLGLGLLLAVPAALMVWLVGRGR
jgi:hypothetical protein